MKLYQAVNRVPAGWMAVSLFLGVRFYAFARNALKIGAFTQAPSSTGYAKNFGHASLNGLHEDDLARGVLPVPVGTAHAVTPLMTIISVAAPNAAPG